MQNKNEGTSQFAVTQHGFFTTPSNQNNKESSWQVIYSGWRHTLFFNQTSDTILGFGRNDFLISESKSNSESPWGIPLRDGCKVKQVAAGDNHILILYENGLLDGYGRGSSGQLGIGCFTNRELKTISIFLPNDEIPVYVAASGDSSFVLGDKGTLYGFGSNSHGELGLGKKSTIEFLTPILLPDGAIPEQIFTAHQKTIIACKQGKLYGFGDNTEGQLGESSSYSNWSQVTPVRLFNFEKLQPRAIEIGKNAVVILSADGECRFYGIDITHSIPINYMKGRIISLPPDVKPEQISFTHEHFILLSEQGELWEVGRGLERLQHERKDNSSFVKINPPQGDKIKSAAAGYQATFIFNSAGYCYALGRNDDLKLGLKKDTELCQYPQRLSLRDSYWWEKTKAKTPSTKFLSPSFLFSELEHSSQFQDNTDVIPILEEDEDRVIEIIRPLTFNTSLTLSMLYAFYSNTNEVNPTHFHHKKIGKNQELIKNHQGAHPVVVVDLGQLDLSSYSSFQDSLKQLLADLYIRHRFALFQGYLKGKDYKKDQYQEIATQSSMFISGDALSQLIEYLNKHYGKKVKLFIDHADVCIRYGLLSENYKYIASELKKYIDPVIGHPLVSQTVLMGVHPSFFEAKEESPLKRIHGLTVYNSKYITYFQENPEQFQLEKNHFINGLRIKSDECEQIGRLLKANTLEIVAAPEKTIKDGEMNIFNCLIQVGLLTPIVKEENTGVLTCRIANPTAKSILQTLHKKWQIQSMNRVTIIFDIDNVLATHDACTLQTILFFLRKGAIIKAYGVTHYIPPGILELMNVLFSMPMVKVAFFSSGDKNRNEAFVKELLIKALGEKRYLEIASEIIILSSNHMSGNVTYKDENQQKKYGLPHSSDGKKDISYAIAPEDTLGNAIFIDNNPAFIYYKQEENYLHSETVKSKHFDSINQSEKPCNNPEDDLFRKVNAAFYLAGVLSDCINSKDKEPVSKQLFSLQFVPTQVENQDSPTFAPCWDQPKKSLVIYEKGLQVLQQYNSELTLITSASYKNSIERPASENQQTAILDAKEHEYEDNCLVM